MPPGECCQTGIIAAAVSPPRNSSKYASLKEEARRFSRDGIDAMFRDEEGDAVVFVSDWGLQRATVWSSVAGHPAVRHVDHRLVSQC